MSAPSFSLKNLNLPDWLSLYRVGAAPVLIVLAVFHLPFWFGIMLGVSLLTDMIDGLIARSQHIATKRGALLDSVGDAITFILGLAGLVWMKTDFVREQLILILPTFGLYMFQLGLAYWRYGRPSSFHTYMAKLAALVQGLFLLSVFLYGVHYGFFYAAITVSLTETVEEIILIFLYPKWVTNIKGLYWAVKDKNRK